MIDNSQYKFTWIITRVDAIPVVEQAGVEISDVVNKVEWQCQIYEYSDHSVHLEMGITELSIDGVNPDNFTDFLELTKEQICEWINDIEHVEERLVEILQEWKRPMLVNEARSMELPWMKDCCPDGTGFDDTGTQQ